MNDKTLYDYAMSFIGRPYYWGGCTPMTGFDCSGFVLELLKACGLIEPKKDLTAQNIWSSFMDKNQPSFGALAFYGRDASNITHVGFCLDDSTIIEAGGGGVDTTTLQRAVERQAFIRLRPIYYRKDFLLTTTPPYPWRKKG